MRRANLPDAFEGRLFVQKSAAAAIHLQIDEAGNEQQAARVDDLAAEGHASRRRDRLHVPRIDDEGGAVVPVDAVENPRSGDRLLRCHRVSVTFLRFSGASGLSPRERDQASTKP